MKSLTIASLVSALCTLWLSSYVAEGATVKITKCDINNQMEGSISLKEINIDNDQIVGSLLDIQQEMNMGMIKVQIKITNEDNDVMFSDNNDFCSMSGNDFCKSYLSSFEDSEINKGNCPMQPGSYRSGKLDINADDAPEGIYNVSLDIMEGSNQLSSITCEVKVE